MSTRPEPHVREDRVEAPSTAPSSSGCVIAAVVALVVGLMVVFLFGVGALIS